MSMDNRLFNVNGAGQEMLLAALQLVFAQSGSMRGCESWSVDPDRGLILLWWKGHNESAHAFPSRLTALQCLPFVAAWLDSDDAKKIKLGKWEGDIDHDGDNSYGWRVYCEDWGHVGGFSSAICAVKPCVLWHGK